MATILIVDAEPHTSKILQDLLESEGHWVITAGEGAEALACTRLMRIDLILSEASLGDMQAIELCQRLRTHAATRSIPILFMSQQPLDLPAEENLAVTFVHKPVSAQSLFESIQWYLPPRHARSAAEPPLIKAESLDLLGAPRPK